MLSNWIALTISHTIVALLSGLGGWFLKILHLWWMNRQSSSDNQKIADETKAAQTKEEREKSAKDIISGL